MAILRYPCIRAAFRDKTINGMETMIISLCIWPLTFYLHHWCLILTFFIDIGCPDIVELQVSDTDINGNQYRSLYCDFALDVSHDVISLLAASHRWNHTAETLALSLLCFNVLWWHLVLLFTRKCKELFIWHDCITFRIFSFTVLVLSYLFSWYRYIPILILYAFISR